MDLSASAGRSALVLEDDVGQRHVIEQYLKSHGYVVSAGADLSSARQLLHDNHFSIILLDLGLGLDDGTDLLRELGSSWSPPVIVISGRGDETDRIVALELGADDYLVKPFSLRELLARMSAVSRRMRDRRGPRRRRAVFADWKADLTASTLTKASGEVIELTAGELILLRIFLESPNRVLARHDLLTLTRRGDAELVDRTIDVLVARLRSKIETDTRHPLLVQTVRGVGYRFAADVAWSLDG